MSLLQEDSQSKKEFSKVRSFVWPIHGSEIKKFLPMAVMMFCVLFNYTMLRNTKDALAITASGPEVIPFLKGWVIMPTSIGFVWLYSKLSNVLSKQNLFYFSIGIFFVFFAAFTFILYPNQMALLPDPSRIAALKQSYPHFQHLISLWGQWTFSLFYLFSEMWGAVVLGLLFWQFANDITRTEEAKRFYTMFAFLGHWALIAAGFTVKTACKREENVSDFQACGDYISTIVMSFLIATAVIIFIYWWLNKYVLTDKKYYDQVAKKPTQPKKKPPLWESFKYVLSSPYLGYIALMVAGYGLSQNLMGLIWKRQIKMAFPDPLDFGDFMGTFYMLTGVITVSILFFAKNIIYRFGWLRGAIATPLAMLVMVSIFLSFIFFEEFMTPITVFFGVTPLLMSVWWGSAQQLFTKSAKYALFDPSKEMSYIPLDDELKVKGKATVDVTGHLFSKALGGYVVSILLIITAAADLFSLIPYFSIIVYVTVIAWLIGVFRLNKRYTAMVELRKREVEAESRQA